MPFPGDAPGTSQTWYPVQTTAPDLEAASKVTVLPTAGVTYRGSIVYLAGDGSTTADIAYICLMSATGTYSWKQLASG